MLKFMITGVILLAALICTVGITMAVIACIPAAFIVVCTTGGAAFAFLIGGALLCIGAVLLAVLVFRGLAWLLGGILRLLSGAPSGIFH